MLISEEEDHFLVFHTQLVVQDLQVFTEWILTVATGQCDLKHLQREISRALLLVHNVSLSNLLSVSGLVATFKHLPDSHGTQNTVYTCMQLASKSSSLISGIIDTNCQSIPLSFWVLKMRKIQRENIFKIPIVLVFWLTDIKQKLFKSTTNFSKNV